MGRRGPKPTPTVIRLLTNNAGKRAINHEEPNPGAVPAALAKCPKWLEGEARALWNRIVPHGIAIGLITIVDLPTLEAMCVSYWRWRQAEKLSGDNLELAIAKGYRNAAVKERQLMASLGARFGFDPSSRSNVKLPKKGAKQSAVDRFKQRGRAGAPPA